MRSLRRSVFLLFLIGTVFCLTVASAGIFFLVADAVCETAARFVPSYEKADLGPLIEKEVWTEEDYDLIYRQTGLARAGADSVPRSDLKKFQDAFFFEGEIYHEMTTPITPHDKLRDPATKRDVTAPVVPLEEGDIILTSTTHLFGWRHGHAGLVVNGTLGSTLESFSIGVDSGTKTGGVRWFARSTNFMVLRLKGATAEERKKIADDAARELKGLSYNVFLGFFLPKDQCENGRTPTATHCSHLVWQAYKNAGYDIDPTGGPLVTPDDIANCPLFEVVQIYGFDPDKLWK